MGLYDEGSTNDNGEPEGLKMGEREDELARLRRIEFAAREYLIAGGIQDDLYHETSISDAARRAASDNYGEKKEALRLALRDTSGKGE